MGRQQAQYWTAAARLFERKYPMEYGKMERKARMRWRGRSSNYSL